MSEESKGNKYQLCVKALEIYLVLKVIILSNELAIV